MILAFIRFGNPWLLLGLLATFIPFVLHLLSSVRAQEVFFPTLRFLKMSMEKTARRRRIQHILLLLLRAGLLAAYALSTAGPKSKAAGGWLAGKEYAAVLILDNSFSMAATDGATARFTRAKAAASQLLHGDAKPRLAALMVTNDTPQPEALTARIGDVRNGVKTARLSAARADMVPLVEKAVDMLKATDKPIKSIFFFTDLQRLSFDRLLTDRDIARRAKDVHFLVVNTASPEARNVSVSRLEIEGQRVVNSRVDFTATLVNSSPTDQVVDVGLRVENQPIRPLIHTTLRGTAQADPEEGGNVVTLKFHHRFTEAREYTGEVFVQQGDDLMADNVRRFHLKITGSVEALVVRGATEQMGRIGSDPVVTVNLALDPFGDEAVPWPIRTEIVDAADLTAVNLMGKGEDKRKDVVFLCEVEKFTPAQARALAEFAHTGGTVVFFLGPNTDVENYNSLFLPAGGGPGGVDLLPATIGKAVGQIGPEARACFVKEALTTSEYIKGLYGAKDRPGYRDIQVQRYYRLTPRPDAERLLTVGKYDDKDEGTVREKDDPLVVAREQKKGNGKVVLVATTAGPRWTTFSMNSLFLPMVNRMALLARHQPKDDIYSAGSVVTIRPKDVKTKAKVSVKITPPPQADKASEPVYLPLVKDKSGYLVDYTAHQPGVYEWQLQSEDRDVDTGIHRFVVNANQKESDLRSFTGDEFTRDMDRAGLPRVYVGNSLDAVDEAAREDAEGRSWRDLLVAFAVIVLVGEAAVANRSHRKDEDLIPAHLNAKLAA